MAKQTCNTHRVRDVGVSSTNLTSIDALKVSPTLPAETSSGGEEQEEFSLLGRIAGFEEEETDEEEESMGVDPPCWGTRRLMIGAKSTLGLLRTPVSRENS